MDIKNVSQVKQSSSVEMLPDIVHSAEEKLSGINTILHRFNYEFNTLTEVILGVCKMHMNNKNTPKNINSTLTKIHESANMLSQVANEVFSKIEAYSKEDVQMSFIPREKKHEIKQNNDTKNKIVSPISMPYGRVLIVDDLYLNLSVTKGLLDFYDLHVDTVLSGQAALDKIQAGAIYDIVLMDIMMPDMDGMTAMRSLRKLGYAMPIIAFSANADESQTNSFLQHGFDGILIKPIQIPLLDELLHTFIRNRQPKHVVAKAEEDHNENKSQDETAHQDGCILMIGDDAALMNTLAKILANQYTVKASKKIEDCINLAIKYNVDLIILEIADADYTNYKVLDDLKSYERTRNIPIIVISKNSMKDAEARAFVGGAVDYIKKPIIEDVFKLRVGLHMHHIKQLRDIESLGLVDSLTGANNRRSYETVFTSEWNRAARNRSSLGLLMIDIDHFKPFNDKYGHLNGDEVLKSVSNVIIKTVKRGSDYVFRWGGEEFAVMLPETPLDGAISVAESIRKNIENMPLIVDGESVSVTVSIGVSSIFPTPLSHPKDSFAFCRSVDEALYNAKKSGRNRIIAVSHKHADST